jgi:two-component system LytT family sensor kinase
MVNPDNTRKTWIQEAVIFCAMFALTMLHEWIFINSPENFLKGLVFFLILYAQAQVHRFFIYPHYLQKNYLVYTALSLCTVSLGASILFLADYLWIKPEFFEDEDFFYGFIYHFVICVVSTVTIMALSLMKSYALELQRRNRDQLLLNEMNLKFLHAQLNPHFFFNMLNNLYGVSLTEPERTPALIVKLSELMRYQIENWNLNEVPLTDEINFIENYVDLERERIGKRCDISFNYPTLQQTGAYRIAPLLLIVLVENSFKHSQNHKQWFVHIDINIAEHGLVMLIENSLADENLKKQSTQIGLANIEQRLEFLYKDNHSFSSIQLPDSHRTQVFIKLKNN